MIASVVAVPWSYHFIATKPNKYQQCPESNAQQCHGDTAHGRKADGMQAPSKEPRSLVAPRKHLRKDFKGTDLLKSWPPAPVHIKQCAQEHSEQRIGPSWKRLEKDGSITDLGSKPSAMIT